MRNFLDTASIAQSLDGKRLMGSLHVPNQRIVSDQFGYKEAGYTIDAITDRTWYFPVAAFVA